MASEANTFKKRMERSEAKLVSVGYKSLWQASHVKTTFESDKRDKLTSGSLSQVSVGFWWMRDTHLPYAGVLTTAHYILQTFMHTYVFVNARY